MKQHPRKFSGMFRVVSWKKTFAFGISTVFHAVVLQTNVEKPEFIFGPLGRNFKVLTDSTFQSKLFEPKPISR
jgi:hypothetical protein